MRWRRWLCPRPHGQPASYLCVLGWFSTFWHRATDEGRLPSRAKHWHQSGSRRSRTLIHWNSFRCRSYGQRPDRPKWKQLDHLHQWCVGTGQVTFSTAYTFTGAKLVFSNGPDLTLAGSFSTAANPVASTCNPAAQKYESGLGACVNQPAVKVLKLNKLLAECQLNLDACYNQKVADGTIQFAQSEIPDLVFALYITFDGFTVAYPVHKSDGTPQNISRNLTGGGSNGSGVDWYAGSKNGVFLKASSTGNCGEYALNANKTAFGTTPVTCPN